MPCPWLVPATLPLLPRVILKFSASKIEIDLIPFNLWLPNHTLYMCAAYSTAQKILTRTELQRMVLVWRLKNSKVVFTNGCFDLLHLGHVDYLEKARALGDYLVLGLNSDASVGASKRAPNVRSNPRRHVRASWLLSNS